MQLFVARVHRDDALIAELERDVGGFLDELTAKIEALREAVAMPLAA